MSSSIRSLVQRRILILNAWRQDIATATVKHIDRLSRIYENSDLKAARWLVGWSQSNYTYFLRRVFYIQKI